MTVSSFNMDSIPSECKALVGAVKLTSCKNVTIEGIRWEGCGSKDYGIEFYISSNVSFERCSFHNSKGRSVLLSEVPGDVWINNCSCMQKNEYSGHGAAIHYLPSHGQQIMLMVRVQNCFNRATQSVVYIDGSGIPGHVCLQGNVFVNNTGVPVYISSNNVKITSSLFFKGNAVKNSGGITATTCMSSFMINLI